MVHLSIAYWEGFDRERFETFAYDIAPRDLGPVGERVARAFEHFVDMSEASAETVAERIRADRIQVLIDLNGYTKNSREQIGARPHARTKPQRAVATHIATRSQSGHVRHGAVHARFESALLRARNEIAPL
jgi:hypothetical protein